MRKIFFFLYFLFYFGPLEIAVWKAIFPTSALQGVQGGAQGLRAGVPPLREPPRQAVAPGGVHLHQPRLPEVHEGLAGRAGVHAQEGGQLLLVGALQPEPGPGGQGQEDQAGDGGEGPFPPGDLAAEGDCHQAVGDEAVASFRLQIPPRGMAHLGLWAALPPTLGPGGLTLPSLCGTLGLASLGYHTRDGRQPRNLPLFSFRTPLRPSLFPPP